MSTFSRRNNLHLDDPTLYKTYRNQRYIAGNFRGDDDSFDKTQPCMVGIDEAGRGPVLGPMVYGSCLAPLSMVTDVKALGVNDSKVLKESVRDSLFDTIKDTAYISWLVDIIPPETLSYLMLSENKTSLNVISHTSAMTMVSLYIEMGYNVQALYVDTVGPEDQYQAKLKAAFPSIDTIIVTSKADSKFPIVSAASICAKVTRDKQLEVWDLIEEKHGMELNKTFGSGYPGDEVTKSWLVAHSDLVMGFPSLVRFSWSTADKLLESRGAAVCTWPKKPTGDTNVMAMVTRGATGANKQEQRTIFYKNNHIQHTTTLPF